MVGAAPQGNVSLFCKLSHQVFDGFRNACLFCVLLTLIKVFNKNKVSKYLYVIYLPVEQTIKSTVQDMKYEIIPFITQIRAGNIKGY